MLPEMIASEKEHQLRRTIHGRQSISANEYYDGE